MASAELSASAIAIIFFMISPLFSTVRVGADVLPNESAKPFWCARSVWSIPHSGEVVNNKQQTHEGNVPGELAHGGGRLVLTTDGDRVGASLRGDSERAGQIMADVHTRLQCLVVAGTARMAAARYAGCQRGAVWHAQLAPMAWHPRRPGSGHALGGGRYRFPPGHTARQRGGATTHHRSIHPARRRPLCDRHEIDFT